MRNNYAFLNDLNAQQKEICISKDNLIVTACPGSGKTRTLIYRMAYLQAQFPKSRLLNIAITYTNAAAEEIADRIELLGLPTDTIWSGTIHQFCLSFIIRPYSLYSERLQYGYRIIDQYQSENYWNDIKDKYRIKDIDDAKVNSTCRKDYNEILQKNRELDFDAILEEAYNLICNNSFIAENIAGIIRSIHVDEFQDTKRIQYLILGDLVKKNKHINTWFVGDKNQAIYDFNGGTALSAKEISSIFHQEFKQRTLTGCYRSTQRIVDFYKNFELEYTGVQAVSSIKDDISIIAYQKNYTSEKILYQIADIIKNQLKNGTPENDICVLAPQWWTLMSLGRKLKELLPNTQFNAPDITPFKYDPMNPFYLLVRLAFTESGVHVGRRLRIANEVLDILKEDYNINIPSDYDNLDLLQAINSVPEDEQGIKYYEAVLFSVLESLNIDIEVESDLKTTYLKFMELSRKRIKDHTLSDTSESFRRNFKEKEGIVITTLHGVKGEEYDTVICTSLNENQLPHWKEKNSPFRRDKVNKLLYVVASRAKHNLFLFSEYGTNKKGFPLYPTEELINVWNRNQINLKTGKFNKRPF